MLENSLTLRTDSFKHRRGAGWGTGWRMLEETWARGAVGTWLEALSCSASLGKALDLQKTHFNSFSLDIPVSFNATLQCRAPWISFITHCNDNIHHKLPLPHIHPPVPLPLSPSPSFMSQEYEWGGGRYNRNQSHLIISVHHLKLGKEKAESFPTTWGQCYLSSWLVLLFTKKPA